MSSKNDTEINSIIIPSLAAAVFCGVMLVFRLIGPEGEPQELGESVETPIMRTWTGLAENDGFGRSVLGGLDLDGDGESDVVIGAPQGTDGGYVSAFSGRTGEPLWPAAQAPEGLRRFGASLAYCADHNGDGIVEILVGAPGAGAGSVLMLSGADGRALLRADGKRRGESFGARVVGLDDVDGDGKADLAVGAPGDRERNLVGSARVISGADGSIIREFVMSPRNGDRLGYALTVPGDLDGDGAADLVVGAIGESHQGFEAGAVYVVSPRSGALLYRLDGEEAGDQLGHDLEACGDRDGDGTGDILVSACNPEGRGYVLLVSGKTGATIHRLEAGEQNGFGYSVASCVDLDGDGVGEIAVGAPNEASRHVEDVGAVHVFSGASGAPLRHLVGDREAGFFGRALGALGRGKQEILVGSAIARDRLGRAVVVGLRDKKD